MRILGVDPGLDRTGYGLIDVGNHHEPKSGFEPKLVEAGLIRTPSKQELSLRLKSIAQELQLLIEQKKPDCMAVEDLYSYYKTPQPAILMGHVRGVILATAAMAGLSVVSFLPTRVKHAVVGRGHASKEQVARMVRMRLNLSEEQVPPDVTDALAVALCRIDGLKEELQGAIAKV